jgi:ABC-type transport system substrate-binding protein
MNQSLKIYLGNFNTIPYEFKTSTGVLCIIHPVLYGYLLRSSEAQEISPGIIEKWEFDHKDTFTLKLGNTKFHNGREVNAKDLEFSIIRGFISDYPNYNKIHFSDIDGIEKLKVGEKYQSGMASGIQVVDQITLKIKIKNKNPMFLINFTIPFVPLVPIEELSENYYTWKNTPVGAGPYRIQDQFKDHVLTLVKSDQLHSGANKIEYHSERKKVEYGPTKK